MKGIVRPRPRAVAGVLVVVALASLTGGAVPDATAGSGGSETVRYLLPVGVATAGTVVGGSIGVDGCDDPCLFGPGPSRIGNPLFAVPGPVTDFTVQINDDHYGQLGATMMCLSAEVNGDCEPGDFWFPSRCGPYYAPGTLNVGEVVVVGLTHRDGPDGTCGATEGYLHLQWQ